MDITASMVKELRERSGAGMMECKRALTEKGGDIEAAMEHLRITGMAKADKKADRVAAEGRIVLAQGEHTAVLVEINSETDFVAKDENFNTFAEEVAKTAISSGAQDVEALRGANTSFGKTVEEGRQWLVSKVGENVQLRRMARVATNNNIGAYAHGGRIGVLVDLKGGDAELARGLAMHIAAMNPPYISAAQVPAEIVQKEKDIAMAQVKDTGKPAEILEKMIAGKVNKALSEISLTGQAYVLDTNSTIEAVLKKANAEVISFTRMAVGEGIEKKEDDFAAEVMKQAGLA